MKELFLKQFSLAKTLLLILLVLAKLASCQTDLYTMSSCVNCLSVPNNFVCKDNIRDTAAYCCPGGSIANSCRRNYCSPMANTTSMKFFSCPYEAKTCGSMTSTLVAEVGKIYTVQANTNNFVQNSICYWTIKSNLTKAGLTAPNNTFLEIRGNKL